MHNIVPSDLKYLFMLASIPSRPTTAWWKVSKWLLNIFLSLLLVESNAVIISNCSSLYNLLPYFLFLSGFLSQLFIEQCCDYMQFFRVCRDVLRTSPL